MSLLAGKLGIVFGVANKRSIAWAIAQAWHRAGARLVFTYQGERLKENVEALAGAFGADTLILPCDVTRDDDIAAVTETQAAVRGPNPLGRSGRTLLRLPSRLPVRCA